MKQLTHNKKRTVKVCLIITWLWACGHLVIRNTVLAFKMKDEALYNKTSSATSTAYNNEMKYYLPAVFLLFNVFPFAVVFYLYTKIIIKLQSREKELRLRSATNQGNGSAIKNQRKTVIMLIIVPVVFLVCGWPYTILNMIMVYMPEVQSTNDVQLTNSLLRILASIPSAINPIIYNFFSKRFHAGFHEMILTTCKCNR